MFGTLAFAQAPFSAAPAAAGPVTHSTTGTLTGLGSTLSGTANRSRAFIASGTLTGPGAIIVAGTANHISLYPDPSDVRAGVQYGPGGIYVGTLESTAGELNISLRSFGGRF
jgi:hypothetical protein